MPAAINPCKTLKALTPSIHIIVVVVSPTTLPLPPALLAATIAAIYPICTLFLKTTTAMAPPIRAAAILSRNDDNINMKTRSTNGPFQSSGRKFGKISGAPDSSNILDKIENPSKSPRRFNITPHSPCLSPLSINCSRNGFAPKRCSKK